MSRPKPPPLSRSEQMARIRGRDTTPELAVRRGLWAAGVRYRLHQRTVGGRADLVVPAHRFALFIDGCFWHGCPEHYVRPRSRNTFWDAKLAENVARDRRQTLALEAGGWRVLRVWEHDVREAPDYVVQRVLACLSAPGRPSRALQWRVTSVQWLDPIAGLERRHLEDLRDPSIRRTEEGRRSTRKVGRVRRTVVANPVASAQAPRSRGRGGPNRPSER